jgi:NAD(P)-dependent dehydrogenase (short-subunit alcohol dehydrogenase family)
MVAEIEAAGGQARFVRTDVTNEADIALRVGIATSSHGRLDFAFNNVGIELSGAIETVTHTAISVACSISMCEVSRRR